MWREKDGMIKGRTAKKKLNQANIMEEEKLYTYGVNVEADACGKMFDVY